MSQMKVLNGNDAELGYYPPDGYPTCSYGYPTCMSQITRVPMGSDHEYGLITTCFMYPNHIEIRILDKDPTSQMHHQ